MSRYDLSILIPAKNEEWLSETVRDILKNKRGKTEVIVGMDGNWAEPGIEAHPDVRIVYVSKSRGQRGMTNMLCKLSKTKYVAKCDAHCAFDEGFDQKLMDVMEDDMTIVPVMRNLHVFNWQCMDCGDEVYQGPQPEGCKNCDVNTPDRFEKKLVWRAKPSPNSSAYKFTPNRLQFKYFGSLKSKQQTSGEKVVETMSLQGSFFMLPRTTYWKLNICDETWGGWGQQGTEVALKTWLSGGRVVCNLDTWYAHLFRTQSGFAFPWGNPAKQQNKAREVSYELFTKNQWVLQTRPLSWLVERFWDTLQQEPDRSDDPKWTAQELVRLKQYNDRFRDSERAIIYTTHNQLSLRIAHKVQNRLLKISQSKDIPIISCTLKPIPKMGKNIVHHGKRGVLSMFMQLFIALQNTSAKTVYICEHDVLYHESHFNLEPPTRDKFYYNQNWWRIRAGSDVAVHWDANQVSGLICDRELLMNWLKEKIKQVETGNFDRSYEPGGRNGELTELLWSEYPNIDIRGDWNQTKSKWSPDDFRDKSTCANWREQPIADILGWDDLGSIL